ncbi:MAG: T9SS type A sorting domain-containing protein [Ferruginibacter sp.]
MKQLLLIFSLLISVNISYCQLNYLAVNGINTNGGYTDLGSNGTMITTASFDDANSAPQEIGFDFIFNGITFTQFVLNTNGVIKLGATAPAEAKLDNALSSSETNLIYPLNFDLIEGSAPEYRVYTSGAAPNRLCTIQFKNLSDYFATPATASQFGDMNFQIRLYETSNNIEFVYGTFSAGTVASASITARVGIKGDDAAGSVNVTKASATAWTAASFIDGNYVTNAHNIRNTVLPVPGETYVFRSSSALPIKLSGFGGTIQNNTAILNWVTGYENNNDRFEVERSSENSGQWLKTGTVIAVGNTPVTNKYQFADPAPGIGKWLYRLKIYDKDGKFSYSPVVVLQVKGKSLFILGQNYPNPVRNITMIGYEIDRDAIVSIELYSMDGKKVMARQNGKQAKGSYNFPIDVESLSLSTGKYIYRILVQDVLTHAVSADKKEMDVIR